MFGRELLVIGADRDALRRLHEAPRALGVVFEIHSVPL